MLNSAFLYTKLNSSSHVHNLIATFDRQDHFGLSKCLKIDTCFIIKSAVILKPDLETF